VPGASIGYQKHLLSLKVMTSQTEQGQWLFIGGFGRHGRQWVKKGGRGGGSLVSLTLRVNIIFD